MTENHSTEDSGLQESFLSHLFELRDRIIKAGLAIVIVFAGLVYWAPDIFHLFAQPLLNALPAGGKMIVTDVTGSFFVPMKVTMLAAFMIALPVVMYQLWAFIAPGLYLHERKLIVPLVIVATPYLLLGWLLLISWSFQQSLNLWRVTTLHWVRKCRLTLTTI